GTGGDPQVNSPGGASGASGGPGTAGASGNASPSDGGGTTPSGDAAPAPTDGDQKPSREMMVDTAQGRRDIRVSARQADPNSHAASMQIASVDTSKPLQKKLCVVLGGIGTGPGMGIGAWAASKGFHVFQVGYSNAISMTAKGDTNPDSPGNTRMNQFDGK